MRRLSSICIVRAMLLLCFFAFSAKTFSQELKPTYVPSENRWYSLIDPTRYSERNQLTQEYQLSSTCYKPFQEFYFDLCVLGYIDGSFTSPFYLNVKVDEKKVYSVHSTGCENKNKPCDNPVPEGTNILNQADFVKTILTWERNSTTYPGMSKYTGANNYYASADIVDDAEIYYGDDMYHQFYIPAADVPHLNPSKIVFEKTGQSSTTRVVFKNLRVPLAKHVILFDEENPTTLVQSSSKHFGIQTLNSSSEDYVIPLRSFLLNNNGTLQIKMEAESGDQPTPAQGETA